MGRASTTISALAGGVVTIACAAVIAIGAAVVSPPPAARSLPDNERREVARSLAAQEAVWRLNAERLFPGDRWSQDDDFFNQEHREVRRVAAERRTSPGEILRGIDQELRATPGDRKVTASPNKPRPFYD